MNMEWTGQFSRLILMRGYNYYSANRVFDVNREDDCCKAVVRGSCDYDVEIRFKDDDIDSMDCSCPYASDGAHCKHEAALLYYISSDNSSNYRDDVKSVIDSLNVEDMKSFIYEAVLSNCELLDFLFDNASNKADKAYLNLLSTRVMSIVNKLDNFDYYYDEILDPITTAIDELRQFLDEKVYPLTEHGNICSYLFNLVYKIFNKIPRDELDDYGYDNVNDVIDILDSIMENAYINADDKMDIAEQAREYCNNSCFSEKYKFFLIFTVKDKILAKEELESLHSSLNSDYSIYPIAYVVQLMEMLEYSESDVRDEIRKHLDCASAQVLLARRMLANNEWQECIETIKLMQSSYGKNTACVDILKDIYKKHDMNEALADLIYSDLINNKQYNMDDVEALRGIVSKDKWIEIYNELKKSESVKPILPKLFVSMKDYSALMDWFEKSGTSSNKEYGKILLRKFPKRTIDVYRSILKDGKRQLNGRSSYYWHAAILENLLVIEEGKVFVLEYIRNLLEEYPKRPALKDEMLKMLKRNNISLSCI